MKKITLWAIPAAILFAAVLLKWEQLTYYALSKAAQFYGSRSQIVIAIETLKGSPFSETILDNISISPSPEMPQAYRFRAQTITWLWEIKVM